MQPPTTRSTATATATATTTSTYTTIPISGNDVISRSLDNISSFLSLRRPWPEMIAAGEFNRPESLAGTGERLRKNGNYFRLNYAIMILICSILSLIGTPLSLLLILAILGLWLILYFFREDPLFLSGHHVSEPVVLVGLVSISAVAFWFSGVFVNLMLGVGIGFVLCALHGVFRNPDGLFMDESEAVSKGVIGSGSGLP